MEKYRPSNGSEGMWFMEKFCENCIHDNPDLEKESPRCEIIALTMCLDAEDDRYPEEWTYDADGNPVCTNFKKWDWGNDGDPEDPDNPKSPVPVDPKQLCLPFEVNAIVEPVQEILNH